MSFTGELLEYYEVGLTRFWLYRWLDKGYLVLAEDDKRDEKTIYPYAMNQLARQVVYRRGFTAEEVARQWPRFANTVGIELDTDIYFGERSP